MQRSNEASLWMLRAALSLIKALTERKSTFTFLLLSPPPRRLTFRVFTLDPSPSRASSANERNHSRRSLPPLSDDDDGAVMLIAAASLASLPRRGGSRGSRFVARVWRGGRRGCRTAISRLHCPFKARYSGHPGYACPAPAKPSMVRSVA